MNAPNAFSIVPFTDIDSLPTPDNGPYLVATKTGYFVHRDFFFGRVLVPTKDAPLTPEAQPTLWHTIDPKIPHQLIGQALSFFRAIYEQKKSEAMVDITWHNDHGYRLFVPPQTATGGGVTCKRTPEHYQGQIVGTIHSHCNFNAFHSTTDTHDADGHDGLHITIGDVMKPNPSIAIMISVAKAHWDFTVDEISDGPLASHAHPEWWERYVSEPIKTTAIQPYKPTGIGAWAPKHITGPTKQNPVVISDPKTSYGAFSLDALLWRYEASFTDDEQMQILTADSLLETVREALSELGIEMDTEFIPTFSRQAVLNADFPHTIDGDNLIAYLERD